MPTKHEIEILTAAIEGFEAQKMRIDAQIAEIRQLMTGGSAAPAPTASKPARKKMSAAGRKRIAEAQRKRWAEAKKQPNAPKAAKSAAPKPKRKLSAEGRKNIIEATKRRWAAVKAAAAKEAK